MKKRLKKIGLDGMGMNNKHLCLSMILWAASTSLFGQSPRVEKIAEWSQQGYYILNPVLSPATNELAFVRRLSGKDSSREAQDFTAGATVSYLPGAEISRRLYDPVICLFQTDNRQLSLLDFGWSPAFSPNANRIAYAGQASPLEKQDRLYADSYTGNNIKIFDKATHRSGEVAQPGVNYLLEPFFADSLHLIYKLGARVNGPYGAGISFNEVNLKTRSVRPISLPTIKFFQYSLAGKAYLINKRLAYTLYSPADSGSGMTGLYSHLLISNKDTLHNFGVKKFKILDNKFAYNRENQLLYLDDQHFMAEDSNYLLVYKGDRLEDRKVIDFKYSRAALSSTGKYMLYITDAFDIYLVNLRNFRETKIALPARNLHAVVWNENDTKVALVQDHESQAGTDKIYVLGVN